MKISIWREFKKVFKIAKKEFIIKLLTSIILRGLLLVFPLLFSEAINLATKGLYEDALFYVGLAVAVIILYRISEGVNNNAYYWLYNKLNSYYYTKGLRKTNENSMFSLSRFNLGQYSNLLTTDIDIISAFFGNMVIRVVQLLEFVIIYAYFLALDKTIFVTAVAISMLILLLIPKANKKVEKINGNKKSEYDKMVLSIHEFFKNIKEIKCFNAFDKVLPNFQYLSGNYLKQNKKYFVTYTWNNQMFLMVFEAFRMLSVGYGIYLVSNNRLEIGALLIIYNYYQKIIDNYNMILTMSVDYTNLKVSLERFNHLVEYSSPKTNKENQQEVITEGRIVFDNILYGYKNDPTLENTSFEIEPNSLTVITGKLGISETGIFDLLLKLNRQHQGTITIDGTDIKEINDSEYFSKITSLTKNPTLFTTSILNNFMLVESDKEKIYEMCKKLEIHDEIMALKDGYDTYIYDNSEAVPTQLKQMIVFARTLLKDSKIMLIDEALNGLDEIKQELILNILLKLKENRTIVIITHDRDVLKKADKILLIDNKTMAESGTLKELIRKKGIYYRLYEASTES